MNATASLRSLAVFSGAAVALAGAGAQSARADIIYSGLLNILAPGTGTLWVNFDNGATSTTSAASVPGFDLSIQGGALSTNFAGPSLFVVRRVNNPTFLAQSTAALPSGYIIGPTPGAPFNFGYSTATGGTAIVGTTPAGGWTFNANNTFGFSFRDASNNVRYGWARIALGGSPGVRTLVDYAYENSGGTIAAGAIPTPGAAALLGVGALAGLRRRRRA
ncbi:MAG: hypothetical protein LW822_04905 [Phycisphaeraceae bacterium]|nr:hypothetical protein [Phycisphaeraceae bacterium]